MTKFYILTILPYFVISQYVSKKKFFMKILSKK